MDVSIDDLVKKYIMIRDRIDEEKKVYEAKVAPMKEALEKIEGLMSGILERSAVTGLSTPSGTVYKSAWKKTAIVNWGDFINYVAKNNRYDLLERRVAKTNALEVIEEEGSLPGIEVETGYNVNVRRK